MSAQLATLIAIACYLASTVLIGRNLFVCRQNIQNCNVQRNRKLALTLAGLALILHAAALSGSLFAHPGFNLGFTNAFSLIMWMMSTLLVIAALGKPVENLGLLIFPFATLALVLELVMPSAHLVSTALSKELKFHILTSILAYSMLSIAAAQALLLAIQDQHLRRRQPGGFIRSLPPLQTMETLLFQMIGAGFILHSLSLISGFLYLEDMFSQHMVHKTVLSFIAWLVFGTLIIGRIRHGWRGRTAIRWTLSGFAVLFLAYFGSKMVLEFFIKN